LSKIILMSLKNWFCNKDSVTKFKTGVHRLYLFLDQKRKLKLVAKIKKSITKFDITNEELGLVIN